MANILKHTKVSAVADDPDSSLIRPSDWNAEHVFVGGSEGYALVYRAAESDNISWENIWAGLPYALLDKPPYSVTDGSDISSALTSALAAQSVVVLPATSTGYTMSSQVVVPANKTILGSGMRSTKITKAFNGDMFDMRDGARLSDLYLEGDGDNRSGKCIICTGTNGRQVGERLRLLNFRDSCIDFEVAAGSQSSWHIIHANRWDIATHAAALTGSGLYAFTISATQQLSAVPRTFTHIQTLGTPSFDFGGCNNVEVIGGFIADINYTADSRAVKLVGVRLANQAALTINGHNNTIVGSDIGPAITIASGADAISLEGNSYNNLPIIDNSNNGRNRISFGVVVYTPIWTSTSGTQPDIGNGLLRGMYSRSVDREYITIDFIPGTTTTFGDAGAWTFTTPHNATAIASTPQVQVASGYLQDVSVPATKLCVPRIVSNTNDILIITESGEVNFNTPWAWAPGDILRISISYVLGP